MAESKAYRVFAIEEGTVIDHIPSPLALKVLQILRLPNHGIMSIGLNFPSQKLERKDLVKIEHVYLQEDETNKIALIAPTATINIIKNSELVEKRKITLPDIIVDIMKCPNPNCITNHEAITTRFLITEKAPLAARCYYCERGVVITPDLII
jgi:aspartate carbamoyltransferase regulatory subunit